jgi:uncharacterized protein (TIGR02246 family)
MPTSDDPMTTSDAVAAAIAQSNETWQQCYRDGDAAGVTSRYRPDGALFPPGFDVMAGRDAIEGFWKAAMAMGIATISLATDAIEVTGPVAVETGSFVLRTANGSEIDNGKYLVVWREEAGQWRMHRDIWNTSRATG